MYQDFRVGEFEKPGETGADLVECHNEEIAKEDSNFLHNAYRVWDDEQVARYRFLTFGIRMGL